MSTPTIERDTETTPKQGLTHRLYTGDISYDFIGHRKLWYIISGVLLLISVVALLARGLDLGIEFRGGSDFQATTQVTSTTVTDYRNAVLATGVANLDSTVVTTSATTRSGCRPARSTSPSRRRSVAPSRRRPGSRPTRSPTS